MAKDKDYVKLINSARWAKLRKKKINGNPACERCEEEGRLSLATEVHHVIPVEVGMTYEEKEVLMFDFNNLRALCHSCHVQTHIEMGRSGKKLAQQRANTQMERFKNKFLK